ncbi:hypothetical protein AAMO2058_001114900 [Amorphochlora amoebiformis]
MGAKMGCITSRGGLSVCAQPRKYQPYQNEKFTEKQKLLILNLFNLIDQDGGGLADVGKLYLDFKKKSESSGGLLDDFVEILESAKVYTYGNVLDIYAFGKAFEDVMEEKRAGFDGFLGITFRKVKDASEHSFHVGDRANFSKEEKTEVKILFRLLDVKIEGKLDIVLILETYSNEKEVLTEILKEIKLINSTEGKVSISEFVAACYARKKNTAKVTSFSDWIEEANERVQEFAPLKIVSLANHEEQPESKGM